MKSMVHATRTSTFGSLLCLITAAAGAQTRSADLVLTNGVVYTMDAKRPTAQAVAVAGNRILAVGTSAEIAKLAGPGATVIDLKGATVIPGFKESHGHFLGIGQQRLTVNLVGTTSYQQVIDKVVAAVKAAKPGEWVLGRGWHEGKWTDTSTLTVRGFPTHHALAAVSAMRVPPMPTSVVHAAPLDAPFQVRAQRLARELPSTLVVDTHGALRTHEQATTIGRPVDARLPRRGTSPQETPALHVTYADFA